MHSLLCSKSYELLWQLYCCLRKCLPGYAMRQAYWVLERSYCKNVKEPERSSNYQVLWVYALLLSTLRWLCVSGVGRLAGWAVQSRQQMLLEPGTQMQSDQRSTVPGARDRRTRHTALWQVNQNHLVFAETPQLHRLPSYCR